MPKTRVLIPLLASLVAMSCGETGSGPSTPVAPPPPFAGTIFIDPDIITAEDPSTFVDLVPAGRGTRTMFDRRVDTWITVEAWLFDASYDDGLQVEVQVNPEFSEVTALEEARHYASVIGRIPTSLRTSVRTVWIHDGIELFGGGNDNLLIHVGQGRIYESDGILEETFLHEAAHTSLDAHHASHPGWLSAQAEDPTFISTYARSFPSREDIAETIVPWLAVTYRSDRISASMAEKIRDAIPNRIAYLDSQGLEMYPIQ